MTYVNGLEPQIGFDYGAPVREHELRLLSSEAIQLTIPRYKESLRKDIASIDRASEPVAQRAFEELS